MKRYVGAELMESETSQSAQDSSVVPSAFHQAPPPLPATLAYALGASEIAFISRWVGVVSIAFAVVRIVLFGLNRLSSVALSSFQYNRFWYQATIALDFLSCLAAIALIVGAIGCFQRKSWGRILTLIALITIAVSDLFYGSASSLRFSTRNTTPQANIMYMVPTFIYGIRAMIFPIGTAWLLSLRQVRAIFD